MSDWADDRAHAMFLKWRERGDPMSYECEENIRDALRQARADALDEAAEAVAFLRWQEVDPYDGRSLGTAVSAIRSLKDKQP